MNKRLLLVLPVLPLLSSLPAWIAPPSVPGAGQDAAAGQWVVDPVHSSVVFRIKHANAAWFSGTFGVVEGTITLDPAKPEAGKVELRVPIESIDTRNAQRDTHLKSKDFFNSSENPEITFTSSKIAADGGRLAVTGQLAFAGKSREVTIPVEKVGEGELQGKKLVGYTTTFAVKRSDFGMNWGVADKTLGDEVTLRIDLELNPRP